MRILLLSHSFNSLTQRLFCELSGLGHTLTVEFDIADSVTEEAVALFQPDLIIAPFLKRAIAESVWSKRLCLIVHPGVPGDRGPSALDWAIHQGVAQWGVTVLQAEAEMDAGPVWASCSFALPVARKSSIYRNQVTQAAVSAVLLAVQRVSSGQHCAQRVPGHARPLMKQCDRAINWQCDSSAAILAKLNAADGFPGVLDDFDAQACYLFDACSEATLGGTPGQWLARREDALLRATLDGAIWLGHVKRPGGIKLPALQALPEAARLPEAPLPDWWRSASATWQDIAYSELGQVGLLDFAFYNGAMSTRQCQRLTAAFSWATSRRTKVIVLRGGPDFWSNGIHLNCIEAAASPADESWANINAIDDLAEAILRCASQLTVAALRAGAGAGGCFLARAADQVWVSDAVLLNPHYKNMGNLYGSEFWTYLLPPRVGSAGAHAIMQHRLPMRAAESVRLGFYDACLPASDFDQSVLQQAQDLASAPDFCARLTDKQAQRQRDERAKPLAAYRAEELQAIHANFYGFDPSYHVARAHFVTRTLPSWTPRHLARHREPDWCVPS